MNILDNFLIIMLHVICFIAGMELANKFHREKDIAVKEALERQYLRLQTRSDADDPVRPYQHEARQYFPPAGNIVPMPTGDYDGDVGPITPQFMEQLKTTGKAKTAFKKADLAK